MRPAPPLTPPITYWPYPAVHARDRAGAVTGLHVTLTTVSCPDRPMTLRSDGHGDF